MGAGRAETGRVSLIMAEGEPTTGAGRMGDAAAAASASNMVSGGLDGSSSSDSTAAAAAGGGTKTVTGVEAAAVGRMTAAQPTKDMCCLPASLRSVIQVDQT